MKSIIFAIVCWAAAIAVSAAQNCTHDCDQSHNIRSGNSLLLNKIGRSTQIIFGNADKIFAVTNKEMRFVFAAKGNIIIIFNIENGGYVLIDNRTKFAIKGETRPTFVSPNGTIDNDKLIFLLRGVFSQYQMVTDRYNGAFNFNLLIESFFKLEFDLDIIYSGQRQLIDHLRRSFYPLFKQMERTIVQDNIKLPSNVWGFAVLIIGLEVEMGQKIIEVVRFCTQHFGEINTEIIVELAKRIQSGVEAVREFAVQFVAFLSVQVNPNIKSMLDWINNPKNKPLNLKTKLGDTAYTLVVIKIYERYVIYWKFSTSSAEATDIHIIFANDALFVYNLRTKIAITLYRKYLLVCNVTAQHGLLFTWKLFGILKATVVDLRPFIFDIQTQVYSRAAVHMENLVYNLKSTWISWPVLSRAISSGSESAVSQLVGSENGAMVIQFYYRFIDTTNGSTTVGGIVAAVFGSSRVVYKILRSAINVIATAGQGWGAFIKVITGGQLSVTS